MYKAIFNIPNMVLNKHGRLISEYTYNTLSSVDRQYYRKEEIVAPAYESKKEEDTSSPLMDLAIGMAIGSMFSSNDNNSSSDNNSSFDGFGGGDFGGGGSGGDY